MKKKDKLAREQEEVNPYYLFRQLCLTLRFIVVFNKNIGKANVNINLVYKNYIIAKRKHYFHCLL